MPPGTAGLSGGAAPPGSAGSTGGTGPPEPSRAAGGTGPAESAGDIAPAGPRRWSGGATSHGAGIAGAWAGANRANGSGARSAVWCWTSPSGMGAGSHGGLPGAPSWVRVTVLDTGVTRTRRPWALIREFAADLPPLRPRLFRRDLRPGRAPPGGALPGTALPGIGATGLEMPGPAKVPGKGGAPGTGRMRAGGPPARVGGPAGKRVGAAGPGGPVRFSRGPFPVRPWALPRHAHARPLLHGPHCPPPPAARMGR